MIRSVSLLLTIALAMSGCSSFSKSARSQRAYEKYVRRSAIARVKQKRLFLHSDKPQMPTTPMPSEPITTADTGPQAVPREDSTSQN